LHCQGWAVNIEYTDDPHPRNSFWEMWTAPVFDLADPSTVLAGIDACRRVYPEHYIKINAHNSAMGRETVVLSFIVNRPTREPGFRLDRQEAPGRGIRYTIHSYAADKPEGERYDGNSR
jgi:ribulose-bisphosphate carboxylase small chain